jgi:hypothetical protein
LLSRTRSGGTESIPWDFKTASLYVVQIESSELQPLVGQEVFHDSDAEQPCGTVVQVAKNPATDPNGAYSAIVSMQVSATVGGKLTLGSASGADITLLPLPYPLLEDI